MQRATGIFVAGIAFGALIAFVFGSARRNEKSVEAPKPAATTIEVARTDAPAQEQQTTEAARIVLGNIATVPFQELYSVLSARSEKEMAEIAAQLNDLPPGRDTKTKINTFFAAWAHLDARAALTTALSLKTADAKGLAISAVIRGADTIAAKSLTETLSQLPADTLPAWQKTRSINSALSKWSEVEPAAAAKFLDNMVVTDRESYGARMMIAQNWAATDPVAALTWAVAQGDSREARISMAGVIGGWWETDPRAAEAYVAAHADSLGIEPVMRISSQLYREDPARATEWANSLSTPEARRMAYSNIAMQMAGSDPKAASEWAVRLPDDVRGRTLESVVSRWARNDSRAVSDWINGLNGAMRDEAISAFTSTMTRRDPATALTWAASISDAGKRSANFDRILGDWMRRNPNDARNWVQSSALPEAEKTRLLALPSGR